MNRVSVRGSVNFLHILVQCPSTPTLHQSSRNGFTFISAVVESSVVLIEHRLYTARPPLHAGLVLCLPVVVTYARCIAVQKISNRYES